MFKFELGSVDMSDSDGSQEVGLRSGMSVSKESPVRRTCRSPMGLRLGMPVSDQAFGLRYVSDNNNIFLDSFIYNNIFMLNAKSCF